ncbi:MAG: hypothetical protein AAGK78_14960, partial [Planctomycetota bacterium]
MRTQTAREQARQLAVDFDDADVHWLRAYTHVLSGMLDFALAHDAQRWFDHCGHLLLANPKLEFDFLPRQAGVQIGFSSLVDVIAAIHLMQFPVHDADQLKKSREHFLAAIASSRQTFATAREETDDAAEWIPSGRQTAVFPGIEVTDDIIEAWLMTLDDGEALLNGEKLIPFWRGTAPPVGKPRVGVNLRRVFEEPRDLDLILWTQGTAAAPRTLSADSRRRVACRP